MLQNICPRNFSLRHRHVCASELLCAAVISCFVPIVFAVCVQVSCVGQMLCAVVADTRAHAKRGAAAVKISYEDLPGPIFTAEVRGRMCRYVRFYRLAASKRCLFVLCDRKPSRSRPSLSLGGRLRKEMWLKPLKLPIGRMKVKICYCKQKNTHVPRATSLSRNHDPVTQDNPQTS